MASELTFTHKFEPSLDPALPPLLLLHGTGGDENDLLPLGRAISPGAALLSPRGKVLENGMPRFFRREREGVFDEVDLGRRAIELADFIAEARGAYGIPNPVAVGFSNGANIAAAVLLLRPEALDAAILIRAMSPFRSLPKSKLPGTPVLMLSGLLDSMAPAESATRLATALKESGASVEYETLSAGHGLTQQDLALAAAFLKKLQAEARGHPA
jgi:phospholipase/carboxylesterase